MAYTLNRRLAELIDSNGQLVSGKISNGYISTDHLAGNSITQGKLHSTFALPASAVSGLNTSNLSESGNLYYTDARVQTYISGNRSYGNLTGTTATASGGTNTTALASTAFVQQELTTLIGGAPSTLNDLNELAAAINDDANYNTTLTTALATKLPLAGGTLTGGLIVQAATGQLRLQGTSNTNKNVSIFYNESGDYGQINVDESGVNQKDLWITGLNLKFGRSISSESMRINSSGNVGIGTFAPNNKLDVNFSITGEGSQEGGIKIQNARGYNNDIAPLYFGVHGGTRRTKAAIGLKREGSYGIGSLIFALDSNGDDANVTFANDEKMRITTAGNVHLNTGVDARVQLGTSGTGASSVSDNSVYVRGNDDDLILGAAGNGNISFKENASTRMFIKAGGNVGIGTDAPQRSLDVRHALNIFGSGGYTELMLRGRAGTAQNLGAWHLAIRGDVGGNNDDLMLLRFTGGNSPSYVGTSMHIRNDNGYVGIGTNTGQPVAPLHVQFSNNDGGVGGHLIKNTNTGTTSNFASLSTQAVNGTIQGTFGSAHYASWGGAVTFAGSQSAHPFNIITGNAVRASFLANGRVGIGANAAAADSVLTVQGAATGGGDGLVKFKHTSTHSYSLTSFIGAGRSLDLITYSNNNADSSGIRFSNPGGSRETFLGVVQTGGQGDLVVQGYNGSSYGERVRFKADGNVGIGIASPGSMLHLFDGGTDTKITVQSRVASDATASLMLMSRLLDNSNKNVTLQAYRGNLSITGDSGYGKVGIGTTSPSALLHLKSTVAAAGPSIIFENTNNAQAMNIDYWNNGGAVQSRISYEEGPASWNFIPNTSTGNSALYIAYDGKVGIGTTNASTKLTVKNDSGSTSFGGNNIITIQNANTTDNSRMGLAFTGNTGIGSGLALVEAQSYDQSAGHTSLNFSVYNGSWHNDMMVLKGGRVGIGTADPGHPLSVRAANAKIVAHSTADSQTIGFQAKYLDHSTLYGSFEYTTGDARLWIDNHFTGNDGLYSDITFRNCANASNTLIERMTIKGSSGNVGIGTTLPQGKLHVKIEQGDPGFMVSTSSSNNNDCQFQILTCSNILATSGTWYDVAYVTHSPTIDVIGRIVANDATSHGGAGAIYHVVGMYGSVTAHQKTLQIYNNISSFSNFEYRYLNGGASSGSYRLQVKGTWSNASHNAYVYTAIRGLADGDMYEDD